MYHYNARIIRVIDGDTVRVLVDLGFHTYRTENVRVLNADGSRFDTHEITLRGDTTPEQKALGIAAKEFAQNLLVVDLIVQVKTQLDKSGKYGRFLASITLPSGDDYAALMAQAGHTQENK